MAMVGDTFPLYIISTSAPSTGRITGNHKRLPSSSTRTHGPVVYRLCNIPAANHPHIIPIQTVNLMFSLFIQFISPARRFVHKQITILITAIIHHNLFKYDGRLHRFQNQCIGSVRTVGRLNFTRVFTTRRATVGYSTRYTLSGCSFNSALKQTVCSSLLQNLPCSDDLPV